MVNQAINHGSHYLFVYKDISPRREFKVKGQLIIQQIADFVGYQSINPIYRHFPKEIFKEPK